MITGGLGAYGGASLAGSLGASAATTGMGAGAAGTDSAVAANLTPSTLQPPAVGFTRDMMVGTPPSAVAPQMSMSTVPSADLATQYGLNSGTAAPVTMSEKFANMGKGFENLGTEEGRGAAYDYLGGGKGVMKAGLAAAAPALSAPAEQQQSPYPLMSMNIDRSVTPFQDIKAYEPNMPRYSGGAGNVYVPTFRAAEGGLMSLAKGGMKSGGFVVPADVTSLVGEGNTEAGYKRISAIFPGAVPIRGEDGGQADTVKTNIEGKQPAAVAHGEMYIPPEDVKNKGGAKVLYAMMDKVRQQATGSKKQIKPVSLNRALA
jgi:hypothetical protein